ncbi:MAG: hypothetical protein L0387_07590 [Acidobacteria bacterium]|nr:hypothetical protein [Acidobacteriota bacterium]
MKTMKIGMAGTALRSMPGSHDQNVSRRGHKEGAKWSRRVAVSLMLAVGLVWCPVWFAARASDLGELNGIGGWRASLKKGKDAPSPPRVVLPGLGGSARAAVFRMVGYADPGNTSTQHEFQALSGNRITVELTVKPSSVRRGLAVAIRSGDEASAYIRFNGKKDGWCQHYDDSGTYRDIAPFLVNEENRLKIEVDTSKRKIKAWVNGTGGSEWSFRSDVSSVDRIDLFMTHGKGPEVTALVDGISVRNDEGVVVFSENFERHFPADRRAGKSGWLLRTPAPCVKGDLSWIQQRWIKSSFYGLDQEISRLCALQAKVCFRFPEVFQGHCHGIS